MARHLLLVALVLLAVFSAAFAGTIEGKVSIPHAVVYVDAIPGKTFPAPTAKPVIDQRGLVFTPHVALIQQGTTVEILNSDSVQHNVFWASTVDGKQQKHELGTWPKGEKRAFTFDVAGVHPLRCNIHLTMAAFVVVSPTPYFTQADANGNYKIENVPDGKYNVTAWQEDVKAQTKPVTVAGTGKLDFTLTK